VSSQETEVTLKIGAPTAQDAPEELMTALRRVEVVQQDSSPSGFQLTFEAERYGNKKGGAANEYPLLDTDLLTPMNRVWLAVKVNGVDIPLIDGFIVHQALSFDGDEQSLVTVTGEDASVKMDLFEISMEYQNLTDDQIVSQILGKYRSIGISAQVQAPAGQSAPQRYVPQQNATDRFQVQMLAARHAFVFYLTPGSQSGKSVAYWGPLDTSGDSQPPLTANMGPATNVLSLDLRYHTLIPTLSYGSVLDLAQDPAQASPIAIGSVANKLGLSTDGGIDSSFSGLAQDATQFVDQLTTLNLRGSLLYHPGLDVSSAQQRAQAKTDRSVRDVVTVRGELDVADYGTVLIAPGLVELRGVGKRYDGKYYVQRVGHSISLDHGDWSYEQSFVLARSGWGTTIQEVDL
jgi:hypothetical protein